MFGIKIVSIEDEVVRRVSGFLSTALKKSGQRPLIKWHGIDNAVVGGRFRG